MPAWPTSDMTKDELRRILAALDWSQAEAARQAGLSRQTVNRYIGGGYRVPRIVANFFRLAHAYEDLKKERAA